MSNNRQVGWFALTEEGDVHRPTTWRGSKPPRLYKTEAAAKAQSPVRRAGRAFLIDLSDDTEFIRPAKKVYRNHPTGAGL